MGWQAVLGTLGAVSAEDSSAGYPKVGSAQPSGDWKEAQGADLSPTSHTDSHGHTCGHTELFPESVVFSPGHPERRNQSLPFQESDLWLGPQPEVLSTTAEEAQSTH